MKITENKFPEQILWQEQAKLFAEEFQHEFISLPTDNLMDISMFDHICYYIDAAEKGWLPIDHRILLKLDEYIINNRGNVSELMDKLMDFLAALNDNFKSVIHLFKNPAYRTYIKHEKELLEKYLGKYILIVKDEIIEINSDPLVIHQKAIDAKYNPACTLIRRIRESEPDTEWSTPWVS